MDKTLLEQLGALQFPTRDFAIFGSGPLLVRGIIPYSNDLDILCRGVVWEQVCKIGISEYLPEYDVTTVSLQNSKITFGTVWGIGDFDVDELINTAELINGLPFVQIKYVIRYKEIRNNSKDRIHLKAWRRFLRQNG